MKLYHILLIICSTGLFIFADSLAADWSKNNNRNSLIAIFLIAPVGYIFFGLINKDRTLATSSGIVNMGLLIGTILMSIYYFNEAITVRQFFGMILAFFAIYFLA